MFIKQACVTLICLDVIRCSDVIRERGGATIMSMETSNYCHFKWKYCFTLWCTMKSNSYVGALFFLKSCLHVSPHTDCQEKCRLALDVYVCGGFHRCGDFFFTVLDWNQNDAGKYLTLQKVKWRRYFPDFSQKWKYFHWSHCSEASIECELTLDNFRQVDHRVNSGYVQVEC